MSFADNGADCFKARRALTMCRYRVNRTEADTEALPLMPYVPASALAGKSL
jgi:hypothetical protein